MDVAFAPGERATWMHVPRGGWGIPHPVCVRVLKLHGDRALVEAPLARGGTKQVRVKLSNLRKLKVTVPLPYVTEAAVAVAPHASGVLGVEPFDRWGDTARKGDHRPTLPTPERAATGSSEGGK